MIIGGFIDGRLFYVFKFLFNHIDFVKRLEEQLARKFPNGDESGRYLRSATFGFKYYHTAPDFNVQTFVNQQTLEKYKSYITKPVYQALQECLNA